MSSTTQSLVADHEAGAVTRTYTWESELISEHQTLTTSHYVFDGHGSVRAMTNAAGAVTDTYDYDAFGNLIHSTGTTPNNYLFAGEQFDPNLNLYYNRARYLAITTGRFWTTDSFEGDPQSPFSLHKYLYTSADPVDRSDPSGSEDFSLGDLSATAVVGERIDAMSIVRGIVLFAYLAAQFSGGIVETGPQLSPQDKAKDDPRYPNRMRVQLQEGLDNTFYGVAQHNTAEVGVTVLQMRSALQTLYNMASNDTSFGRTGFPFNALAGLPMKEALQQITDQYPAISWTEDEGIVRVVDKSAKAELLKIYIGDLIIEGSEDPSDAVMKLISTPEVQAFVREHAIEPALRGSILTSPKGAYPHLRLDLRGLTVAQAMDRIASIYRGNRDYGRVWMYEECHSDVTRVELRVM